MADFDPLAALKSQDRFTLGMQQGNNALQELMSRGGIQDILARRAHTDTMSQLDLQGNNALDAALAGNKFLTNRSAPKVTPTTATNMERSRFGEDALRAAQTQGSLGEAGLFAGGLVDDGKGGVALQLPSNVSDLMKDYPLYGGESTKIGAARAMGEAQRTQTQGTVKDVVIDNRTGKPVSPYTPTKTTEEQKDQTKQKSPAKGSSKEQTVTINMKDGTQRKAVGSFVNGKFVPSRFVD